MEKDKKKSGFALELHGSKYQNKHYCTLMQSIKSKIKAN